MIFGNGINVQVTVSKLYDPENAKGDYLSISFGWGLGVLFGVILAGGISGGHINPALTLALAVWRRFPWRKVPVYICAQMAGALVGSLMIYGLYVVPIRLVDPMQTETTAALFTTYPAEFLRTQSTRITTFYNEVFATAVLAAVVFALGDSNNTPPPEGMAPLILMWRESPSRVMLPVRRDRAYHTIANQSAIPISITSSTCSDHGYRSYPGLAKRLLRQPCT